MQKLTVFQNLSLDGYFVDKNGEMSWAKHGNDEEFNAFTSGNARGGGSFIFGRKTYELMASFWPTSMAKETMPIVAERMNSGRKLVFSKTLKKASWENTTLIHGELINEVRKIKNEPGEGLLIFGSGSLIAQLAPHGLIDEYQLVLNPIALGAGRTMFEGIPRELAFQLTRSRNFRNGKVFLCYEPAIDPSGKGQVTIEGEHATITFKRLLPHSPEHVWEAITRPEDLKEWLMCSSAKIDGRKGGSVEMVSGPAQFHVSGKILTWDPPKVYEHEWIVAPVPEMPRGENAIFRYELKKRGDSTLLTVTYRRITKQTAQGFAPGTHVLLDRLEAQLNRTPLPAWMPRFAELRELYPAWKN